MTHIGIDVDAVIDSISTLQNSTRAASAAAVQKGLLWMLTHIILTGVRSKVGLPQLANLDSWDTSQQHAQMTQSSLPVSLQCPVTFSMCKLADSHGFHKSQRRQRNKYKDTHPQDSFRLQAFQKSALCSKQSCFRLSTLCSRPTCHIWKGCGFSAVTMGFNGTGQPECPANLSDPVVSRNPSSGVFKYK